MSFVYKPALNGFGFKLGWLLQCKPAWLLPCKLDWLLILALASLCFLWHWLPSLQGFEFASFRKLLLHMRTTYVYILCFAPCCFVLHYHLLTAMRNQKKHRRAGKEKRKPMKSNRLQGFLSKKNRSTFAKK